MGVGYCAGQFSKSDYPEIIVPHIEVCLPIEKWCPQCRRYKPIEEFYKDAKETTGLHWRCKQCDNSARKMNKRRVREMQALTP